jgi:pilus assembly protein Flp/PilA
MSNLMLKLYADLQTRLATLRDAEEGQGMVEYALILVLVSVVAIIILTTVGQDIVAVFTEVSDALQLP